jgi:hypothetical protein
MHMNSVVERQINQTQHHKMSQPTTPYSWQDERKSTRRVYITDADEADAELSKAFQNSLGRESCGIDIEWKPNTIKNEVLSSLSTNL